MGSKLQTQKRGKTTCYRSCMCRIHKHDNKIFTDHMNYLPENASQQQVFLKKVHLLPDKCEQIWLLG